MQENESRTSFKKLPLSTDRKNQNDVTVNTLLFVCLFPQIHPPTVKKVATSELRNEGEGIFSAISWYRCVGRWSTHSASAFNHCSPSSSPGSFEGGVGKRAWERGWLQPGFNLIHLLFELPEPHAGMWKPDVKTCTRHTPLIILRLPDLIQRLVGSGYLQLSWRFLIGAVMFVRLCTAVSLAYGRIAVSMQTTGEYRATIMTAATHSIGQQ